MPSQPISYDKDVIIIGAGIAGICFAYRLQERNPDLSYLLLEQRNELGGTWSLFKYPGLRCDSDLYTYGFPWQPWGEREAIAKGPAIMSYMKKVVEHGGIGKNIRYNQQVSTITWSSKSQSWAVDILKDNETKETLHSRFIFLNTGYYDYEQPLQTHIPGIERFQGDVIHPQLWPEDFDYSNKSVVVIGSGATAITLLPAMADRAQHITMLQRSPSYILSMSVEDRLEKLIRMMTPTSLANKLIRLKWILFPAIFRKYCIWFPNAARKILRKGTLSQLNDDETLNPNFNPTYNPFEQRMCMCPDGDFYRCIREGKASVKTGVIDAITSDSIKLQSGEELHADIIVTATGLKLQLGGGIDIHVDEKRFRLNEHFVWKGLMFEGLPNLAFSFGYLDASWTLGVDNSAKLACRLLKQMKTDQVGVIVPKLSNEDTRNMKELRFMPLTSTYVEKARSDLPKVGDRGPWRPRSAYVWEKLSVRFGNIRSGLDWIKRNE
ncbi:putative flavoprotein [Annulohypoxylon moriforme]|nr:putative flavoprotein [Annulohypoxylon moriforme]